MRCLRLVAFALLLAMTLARCANAQAGNLIDATHGVGAGSFEVGAYQQTGAGFMRLPSGAFTVAGWTVGGPSGVDWLSAPLHAGHDGTKSLDLRGTFAGAFGEVATVLPTVVGCTYRLQFSCYAGNVANSGEVSVGTLQAFAFSGPVITNPATAQYVPIQATFVATATATTLAFRSLSSDGFGPVIDAVSVVLERGPGNGGIARQVHGCGAAALSITGVPEIGTTMTMNLTGTTGVPFLGLGLAVAAVPFCTCTLGHDWSSVSYGSSVGLAVPLATSFLGMVIGAQGADLLGGGGCVSPQVALTDTLVITIG